MFAHPSPNTHLVFRLLALLAMLFSVPMLTLMGQPRVALADTPVCGPITIDTVWDSSGNDYLVTCDVQIVNGVKLTIHPGTVVKFDLDTALIVDGELVAQGATFTSNVPTPSDGDWRHILFNPTSVDAVFDGQGNYVSGSTIQDSLLEFGGELPALGVIESNLASPFISNNSVQHIRLNTDAINVVGRSTSQMVIVTSNTIGADPVSGNGLTITNGEAISNTITGIEETGIVATNSTLLGNILVGNDRGISAVGSTIVGNTINSNTGNGGIDATSSTITGNTISGNTGYCAGIDADGNSVVTENIVHNNSSTSNGGGICVHGGTVSNNTIYENAASGSGGGIYAIEATVINNFVEGNSATDGGGIYGDESNIVGNTSLNNNASDDGGGIYLIRNSTASNNTVEQNMGDAGGGIYAYNSTASGTLEITGNIITQNTANYGGGIYANGDSIYNAPPPLLTGNIVLTNTAQISGGGVNLIEGKAQNNRIANNTVPSFGQGSGVYLSGEVEFTYNDVLTNTASGGTAGGIAIDGQPVLLQLNNLYGNQPYDAEVVSSDPVDATLNYWGQSPCTAIGQQVYDGDDVPGRGVLTYAPSLYLPVYLTPLQTPTGFIIQEENATTVTLSWDSMASIPNVGCRDPQSSEPESGFYVYYDTDNVCDFDGLGLPEGDSPIHVGQDTSITLTGLSTFNTYNFTVTAYDYLGRESPFSTEVIRPATGFQIFLPVIIDA